MIKEKTIYFSTNANRSFDSYAEAVKADSINGKSKNENHDKLMKYRKTKKEFENEIKKARETSESELHRKIKDIHNKYDSMLHELEKDVFRSYPSTDEKLCRPVKVVKVHVIRK